MASASPPKPWEKPGGGNQPSSSTAAGAIANRTATPTPPSTAPALPTRPDSLTAPALASNPATNTISSYPSSLPNRFAPGPYTGYGGYGNYNYTPQYSRLAPGGTAGAAGGGMYGGLGGYGGGMYGGYGGYGGGYGGSGIGALSGMPNPAMGAAGADPNSLTQSFNQSTAATFQMIESIVGALGGFTQMLESTYLATHSSFFAMVSVAEQFGNLRDTLGQVLGIFAIIRWLRTALARLTGRPPPADAVHLTPSAFSAFLGDKSSRRPSSSPTSTSSRKPFIIFMAIVVGLPYIMRKLIHSLASKRQLQQDVVPGKYPNGLPGQQQQPSQLDPSKLDFCRVLYDYTPAATPGLATTTTTAGIDLTVKKGDLVAVLSRCDPTGAPSQWWRCRARDGSVGYLPGPYLETIQRMPRPTQPQSQPQAQTRKPTRKPTPAMVPATAATGENVKNQQAFVGGDDERKSKNQPSAKNEK